MDPTFDPLLLGGLMITFTSVWFGVVFWAGMRHRDTPRGPQAPSSEPVATPTVAELAHAERLAHRLGVVRLPRELEAVVHGRPAEGWSAEGRFGPATGVAEELARTAHARH